MSVFFLNVFSNASNGESAEIESSIGKLIKLMILKSEQNVSVSSRSQ